MTNQNRNSGGQSGGQTGNGGGQQMKFVPRFEMAVMQYVILSKAKETGGVTRENLQQVFRGNMQMQSDHLDHCIRELVSDGHLKESGNKYTISDDGREDIQKLQHLVLELPNVIGSDGRKTGVPQQATTGGQGNMGGGNVSGGNVGNKGSGSSGGMSGGNMSGGNVGGNKGSGASGNMGGGNVGGGQGNKSAGMSGGASNHEQGKQRGFDGATGGQSSQGVGSGSSGASGNVGTGGSTGQTLGNQGDFGRSNSGKADKGSEWKMGDVNKGGATHPSVPDDIGNKTGSNNKTKNG